MAKIPIAVISESSDHSRIAAFTCTNTIVNELKKRIKDSMKKVILWSDGCPSQFRSKYGFALMTYFDKLVQVKWHYNEAHNEKVSIVGVGETIKRVVFGLVKSNRITIKTAEEFAVEVPKAVLSIMKIPCRSSIKDIRTNLRVYWDLHPLPLSRPVHIWLTTPSPISMLTQGWHYLKHCNLRTIHTEGYKELIILILDVHTCVFLLDNFDNSIPKDGVDHEGNMTHRHDWPNKNASVPKSLSGKRKDFIFQSL